MKRILLSFFIAFVLIVLYLTIAAIFVVATDYKLVSGSMIDYPLRLPKYIFYYFSPPIQEDFTQSFSIRKLTLTTISFLGNLFIYAIPAYVVLFIISKFKKTKQHISTPPLPPKFYE